MIELFLLVVLTILFWAGIALAAAKGWASVVIAMVGLLVMLHFFIPGFVVANTWVVSVLQVRKDYLRKEYYFDVLEPEAATGS